MGNSWFFSGKLMGESGHSVERPLALRGKRWGHPLGRAHPLVWLPPSPIKGGGGDLSQKLLTLSHFLSYPLVGISPLACSTSRTRCLGEALSNFSLHHHHVVVLLEVPEDPLLPLPTGARGGGRRRSVCVTE